MIIIENIIIYKHERNRVLYESRIYELNTDNIDIENYNYRRYQIITIVSYKKYDCIKLPLVSR